MAILGQFRGDLRTEWEKENPIIHEREFILVKETTNGPWTGFKVGDGVSRFSDLGYASTVSILQVLGQHEDVTVSQKCVTDAIKDVANMSNEATIYNATDRSPIENGYHTLKTAIASVPEKMRKAGFIVTFQDSLSVWEVFQFAQADVSQWSNTNAWQRIVERKEHMYKGNVQYTNIKIDGIEASFLTSKDYGVGEPDQLIIHCMGKNYVPGVDTFSRDAMLWCSSRKVSVATIRLFEDASTGDPKKRYSGYGNPESCNRVVKLYEHLQAFARVKKSVILIGSDLGGLTMGNLAHKKPFPILFCLGFGIPTDIMTIYKNIPEEHMGLRLAYGLDPDGSRDRNLSTAISGYNWASLGVHKYKDDLGFPCEYRSGFPSMYLYFGVEDGTLEAYGYKRKYFEIEKSFMDSGLSCTANSDHSSTHDSETLFMFAVNNGVFEKEAGII